MNTNICLEICEMYQDGVLFDSSCLNFIYCISLASSVSEIRRNFIENEAKYSNYKPDQINDKDLEKESCPFLHNWDVWTY